MYMLRKLLILLSYLSVTSYVSNPYINNICNKPIDSIKSSTTYARVTHRSAINKINNLEPPSDSLNLIDKILDITIHDTYLGKIIVQTISAQLPNVDSIGHNVLRANNEFINSILSNPDLTEPIKKMIVLGSIKIAIMGDNMGSTLLQLYYDIVDKCL